MSEQLLTVLRRNQPAWFSKENQRFFGDVSYKVLRGKASGKPYLVRATYAWSDMFNQEKKLHYRINQITDDPLVGKLLDPIFPTMDAVREWLRKN